MGLGFPAAENFSLNWQSQCWCRLIESMDKKYQVFISSTQKDLKEQRDAVTKAILEMGHIPLGMEMFSAANDDSWTLIKRKIDESDYYVLIMANWYGSTHDDGVSYTEKEYEYALSQGVPAFGFLIESNASWPGDMMETENLQKLEAFRARVKSMRQVAFWDNAAVLAAKVMATISKEIPLRPRPGWIRGDQAATPEMAAELTRLSKENADLRAQLETTKIPEVTVDVNSAQAALFSHPFTMEASFTFSTRNGLEYEFPLSHCEVTGNLAGRQIIFNATDNQTFKVKDSTQITLRWKAAFNPGVPNFDCLEIIWKFAALKSSIILEKKIRLFRLPGGHQQFSMGNR